MRMDLFIYLCMLHLNIVISMVIDHSGITPSATSSTSSAFAGSGASSLRRKAIKDIRDDLAKVCADLEPPFGSLGKQGLWHFGPKRARSNLLINQIEGTFVQ